jgi:hypothetical protein
MSLPRSTPVQTEDDTAILGRSDPLQGVPKLGYVPAVNGNSSASATPLTINVMSTTGGPAGTGVSAGTGTGLVIHRGVANFFSFTAAAGPATITGKVSERDKA